MVRGNRYKTIRWSFVESLEPPRVVHIRCNSMVNPSNLYGQVTVRMHTRQVRPPAPLCLLTDSSPGPAQRVSWLCYRPWLSMTGLGG